MPTVGCSTQMMIAPTAVCNEIYSNTLILLMGKQLSIELKHLFAAVMRQERTADCSQTL